MRSLVLAFALSLAAAPVLAGMVTFDLPHLTFPTDDQTTTSTKTCVPGNGVATTLCQ